MSAQLDDVVGSACVIEAGRYADETGVVVAVSKSGRTLDVLTSSGVVSVRRTSVELYS
jgi:fructoselysine-6-P-deglycase FrlB-like protein